MKVDLEGEVLWNEIIHEPSEGVFRNVDISAIGEQYVVSGASDAGVDTEGYLEIVDGSGDILWSWVNNESALYRGIVRHSKINDQTLLATQSVAYSLIPGSVNPILSYTKVKKFLVDIQGEFIYDEIDYFADSTLILGGVTKSIVVGLDEYIMLGVGERMVDGQRVGISFIMKTAANGDIEWLTDLFIEQCQDCENKLWDIERTSDGGYVMVGEFTNYNVDPRNKTWLVKVDACGDLEWQGCAPVGIGEFKVQDSRLRVYPNPASNHVLVASPLGAGGSGGWQSLSLFNITGKEVQKISNIEHRMSNYEVEIDVSNLPSGLYSMALTTQDGKVHSEKLVIE